MRYYFKRIIYRPRHQQGYSSPAWLILGVLFLSLVVSVGLAEITAPTAKPVPLTAISKPQAERLLALQETARREEAERSNRGTRPVVSKVPSWRTMMPRGTQGRQVSFNIKRRQMQNAFEIIRTGQQMGMPVRAVVIAIGTTLQESHLNNYGHLGARNDHDSQGLFQQRPSAGWGTPKQITNPRYAAKKFYRKLLTVRGWYGMPLTKAAQRVQISGFPFAYAKWEKMAVHIVQAYYGVGPYAKVLKGNGK